MVAEAARGSRLREEIREQPRVLAAILERRGSARGLERFPECALAPRILQQSTRVVLLGMGSAYHAAAIGAAYIERLAGIPAHAELATRWLARDPVILSTDVAVGVSLSGETADTLHALEHARRRGAATVALVNGPGSSLETAAAAAMYAGAGEERAIPSTKGFTAQVLTLLLFACTLADLRGQGNAGRAEAVVYALGGLPQAAEAALRTEAAANAAAARVEVRHHFICLGAGLNGVLAEEAALKLQELTYAPAHGFDAAAFRHGPQAIGDESGFAVGLCGTASEAGDVIAVLATLIERGARGVCVGAEDVMGEWDLAARLAVPSVDSHVFPIVAMLPVQWFGYHLALRRGIDPDHPRFLQKSLT